MSLCATTASVVTGHEQLVIFVVSLNVPPVYFFFLWFFFPIIHKSVIFVQRVEEFEKTLFKRQLRVAGGGVLSSFRSSRFFFLAFDIGSSASFKRIP